jgi:hypothetical protein
MAVAGAQSRLTFTADRTDGNFYQADERSIAMSATGSEGQRRVRWILKGGLAGDDVGPEVAPPVEVDLDLFLENGGGVLNGFGVEPFEIDNFQAAVATGFNFELLADLFENQRVMDVMLACGLED